MRRYRAELSAFALTTAETPSTRHETTSGPARPGPLTTTLGDDMEIRLGRTGYPLYCDAGPHEGAMRIDLAIRLYLSPEEYARYEGPETLQITLPAAQHEPARADQRHRHEPLAPPRAAPQPVPADREGRVRRRRAPARQPGRRPGPDR